MTNFVQFLGVAVGAVVAIGVLWWLSTLSGLSEGLLVFISVLVVVVIPVVAVIAMDRRSRKARSDS